MYYRLIRHFYLSLKKELYKRFFVTSQKDLDYVGNKRLVF